jgi:thioredoxin reductase (NADPH)
MNTQKTDIIVIGAGPVGLFAVFQCGMLDMQCHVVDALPEIGGQCTALYPEKPIYDIPSRPVVTGGDLITELQAQAAPFKPTYHLDQQVTALEKTGEGWLVKTSENTAIEAKAIIIAAGAGAFGPNRPPLKNLDQYENKSVFYMVRQKDDFRHKRVVIAGGGDSAVDWALSLHGIASEIIMVHRRDKFRAMPESVAQMHSLAKNNPDCFRILTPYQLSELRGDNGQIESVLLSNTDEENIEIEADALLAFYGLVPNLGPINDWGLNLNANTITVNQATAETNQASIYAVGDIASYDNKLKLILTGFAEVASAAHHAYGYVYPDKPLHFVYSTSKGVS